MWLICDSSVEAPDVPLLYLFLVRIFRTQRLKRCRLTNKQTNTILSFWLPTPNCWYGEYMWVDAWKSLNTTWNISDRTTGGSYDLHKDIHAHTLNTHTSTHSEPLTFVHSRGLLIGCCCRPAAFWTALCARRTSESSVIHGNRKMRGKRTVTEWCMRTMWDWKDYTDSITKSIIYYTLDYSNIQCTKRMLDIVVYLLGITRALC